ncbi:glycosyltransferase [Paenibacillus sp. sgz500958]|uniref:glycosyltransferase n=1 Tax=Paenibacillus sp. sgz500958 TaxID=3242475 RepID=UPI0036D31541
MIHKKKLLFVMNSLVCGGAEKSLISLLQSLDYSSYEVDLMLLSHTGMFMGQIPDEVRLLPEPPQYQYFDMPIREALRNCLSAGRVDLAIGRIRTGLLFRNDHNPGTREQALWKYSAKALRPLPVAYDAAIGFLEKTPIYYVMDKVQARVKIGFIHNDYDKLGMNPELDRPVFERLDRIATVSEECVRILKRRFPEMEDKIELMHNIVSPSAIIGLSNVELSIPRKDRTTIVSVGRLNYQKGFALAVEACSLLVENGYDVRWYIVGDGEERPKLERLIKERGVEDHLILAGLQENPYPYIKQCDIYVQTSLFEGRCLTITEAKILNKPIVSTDFEVIYDQLTDGLNGIVVGKDGHSIYEGIRRLIEENGLKERLSRHLAEEELGTEAEIGKLYQWIS